MIDGLREVGSGGVWQPGGPKRPPVHWQVTQPNRHSYVPKIHEPRGTSSELGIWMQTSLSYSNGFISRMDKDSKRATVRRV